MLVLSRQRDEEVVIDLSKATDDEIAAMRRGVSLVTVVVVDIRGDKVRLGLNATRGVQLHRREIYEAKQNEQKAAAAGAAPTTTVPAAAGEGA